MILLDSIVILIEADVRVHGSTVCGSIKASAAFEFVCDWNFPVNLESLTLVHRMF